MKSTEFIKDIRAMDVPTLLKEMDKINDEISLTRNALTFGKEKSTKKILALRKKRSRIWTIIYEKMKLTLPEAGHQAASIQKEVGSATRLSSPKSNNN